VDELTFDGRKARIQPMKRPSKNLVAFGLVLFFAVGLGCATLAAPGLSTASVTGCSQSTRAMEMAGCEHPSHLCGFDSSSNPFFHGAFSSFRYNNPSINVHAVSIGEVPVDASKQIILLGEISENIFLIHRSRKVSIRLFNSTLNL
jgi:hypothetical protein